MADLVIVIGTSLAVYPAAGLLNYATSSSQKYYIDPKGFGDDNHYQFAIIKETAGVGVPRLVDQLLQ
jgi:NAD-dependent deacetylase